MPKSSRINDLEFALKQKQQELARIEMKVKAKKLKQALGDNKSYMDLKKKMAALSKKRAKIRAILSKKVMSLSFKRKELEALEKVVPKLQKINNRMTERYDEMELKCKEIEEVVNSKLPPS